MANEFVIKNGYFSQGNSNVTGSLQVSGSIGVIGSGSDVLSVYGSQGNLLIVNDTFSGSLFTITDISGYQILDITSDYYTSHIEMIGTASLTGSLSITQDLDVKQNLTASKALFSSSNGNQLTVIGSGSTIAQVYGSQGNLLTVNDTFSGSIFTVTDISGYPILDITSDYYTGSVFLPMMQSQSQQHVVVYNSQSGLLTYTPSNTVGGGISFPYTITSSAVAPIFNVSGGIYFEIGQTGSSERLFRMKYEEVNPGAIIEMGGLSNGDTVFTVDQFLQTITINAATASILSLTDVAQTNVVTIDTNTGQLFYTASSAIGGGGGSGTSGSNVTASFASSTTWTFTHNLNNRYPIIQTLDSNFNQIVPQNIELTDVNTATITFPVAVSGYAIASLGGSNITQINNTASSVFATTGSNTFRGTQTFSGSLIPAGPYTNNTSSYDLGSATAAWRDLYVSNGSIKMISGSNSASIQFDNGAVTFTGAPVTLPSSSTSPTASYVTNLNQPVTIGNITSTPAAENTLNIYPPPAGGTGEGGQILLAASGGLYTSASMLDTWQNQFRVLKGTNTGGSTAAYIITDLQTGNTQFAGAVTASAYSGLPNDYLYVTRNTSQTVGTNWVSQDIIFNNSVVSKGIAYNTGTGLASLTGGKVYRITARLAWAAAGAYNLQYSCYTSANTQIGPTVEIVQSSNGTSNISDGTLEFIYAPGSNTDIKIRTTAANTALSGESIRGDLNTQLIIQQIA